MDKVEMYKFIVKGTVSSKASPFSCYFHRLDGGVYTSCKECPFDTPDACIQRKFRTADSTKNDFLKTFVKLYPSVLIGGNK